LEQRRAHAAAYTAALAATSIRPPVERPGCRHAYRNYVVRTPRRQWVQEELSAAGIAASCLYVPLLHVQPVYADLGCRLGAFPVAEEAAEEVLSIPVSHTVTIEQREFIIETLQRIGERL
ncbi:MAG: transcriptional regulator, partial [Chloroflexi bacterium]|nr:transcriptional regulator [Chloroflexota bacterium]